MGRKGENRVDPSTSVRSRLPILAAASLLTLAISIASPPAFASVTAPGAPTGVGAIPGNGSVRVSWTAPVNDGGSPITQYIVTSSPGTRICATRGTKFCTVNRLTNGTSYTFWVNAYNGKRLSVASVHVVMKSGVPTAAHVQAIAGNHAATLSFSAVNNGSKITRYAATSSPGPSKMCTTTGATSCTVRGLTNDTTYRFRVTATNAWGTGPTGAPSKPVTPPIVQIVQINQFNPGPIVSDGNNVWVVDAQGGQYRIAH